MAKPDPLFQLIKSMTKTEKRYFKLNRIKDESKDSKDYLRLFDAIDTQHEYDEAAIRKKFKDEPYFKQLGVIKLYLQKQILKSLKNFYDDTSSNIKLNGYLTEIEILYDKELFKSCAATIKKAKAYAEKHEKFPDLLKVIEWEVMLADRNEDFTQVDLLQQQSLKEAKEVIEKYSALNEVKKIYLDSRAFVHVIGEGRTEAEAEVFSNILRHPLLNKEMQTFQIKLYACMIRAHQAQFNREMETLTAETLNIIKLYEAYPHQLETYVTGYISNLLEYTAALLTAKKYVSANRMMQKIKKVYSNHENKMAVKSNLRLLQVETYFLIDQGESKQALDLMLKIKELVERNYHEITVIEEIFFYHLCFDVYFRNKDYKNAQHYLHKVINYNGDTRLDLQYSARVVNLILQYEQQEYEHLGYVLRSTYRYLMKRQRIHKPETIVLDFLRNATGFTSEKQLFSALAELREQILPHRYEPFMLDFPLIEWIDSKLQKKDLSEIVKERYTEAVAKEEQEIKKSPKLLVD